MGCDIHLYREKHVSGQWLSADVWKDEYGDGAKDVPWQQRFTDRNYNLFSILADVRTREEPPYKFAQRGMPPVLSAEVKEAYADGDGGHSASFLYLHELKELRALLAAQTIQIGGMKNRDDLAALKASVATGKPDWSLLYPYRQGTNDPKQIQFLIDAPADYIVGDALDRIIASLTDIGGDNQRIVFWFDS